MGGGSSSAFHIKLDDRSPQTFSGPIDTTGTAGTATLVVTVTPVG